MDFSSLFDWTMSNAEKNSVYPIEELKKVKEPVIIWGGGSLSVSIRKILETNGIKIGGYLIDNSDANSLMGLPVFSREELRRKNEKVNVVLGHAKYELSEMLEKESFTSHIFCITDVCYGQWERTSAEEIRKRKSDYEKLAGMLADEQSIKCLLALLACKISGRWQEIYPYITGDSYFSNSFFGVKGENYLDMGAYDGDSIKDFTAKDPNYSHIYAFEPEEVSFEKLKDYIKLSKLKNVSLYEMGGWDCKAVLSFCDTDESSSIKENTGNNKISVDRIDSILENEKVTLVKINYFYGVNETLKGMSQLIKSNKPNIVLTAGFDAFSVINYANIIKGIEPKYNISLRFEAAMPARMFLYAY